MKKKFLAMLLALTMALSLAACGGDLRLRRGPHRRPDRRL